MTKSNRFFLFTLGATLLELGIIIWLNSHFYKGVFNLGMIIPVMTVRMVVVYTYTKGKLKKQWEKKAIGLFFIVPIVLFLIGKPTYTYDQAKQLVYESHDVSTIVEYKEESYRNTVPIYTEKIRFFINNRDYHYEADNRFFLVNPRTGEVIEMKQPYWR